MIPAAASVPATASPGAARPRSGAVAVAAAAAALGALASGSAAALGTQLLADGLTAPLFATAPLADGRVFIAEKGGAIRVAQGGAVSGTFLDINALVNTDGEQGLLGLAFDPNYAVAGSAGYRRFFVDYIDKTTQDTVIASYRTTAGNASLADPASRVEVMRIDQPAGRTNHKAGWIGFKPGDVNSLFIATGDGGSRDDPDNVAQNNGSLLGKMLRVDVNGDDFAADPNVNYAVPGSNPYVGVAGARGEIFASGLRNPFRASFDRLTGNLWIGDVGQDNREEVDFIAAASAGGQNFGWRIFEGKIPTPGIGDDPGTTTYTLPVLDYGRTVGTTVTGGYVVREAGSELFGRYVFADYGSGKVWAIAGDGSAQEIGDALDLSDALNPGAARSIASFGEGAAGELFIVDIANGTVVQVVPEPGTAALLLAGAAALALRLRRRQT